MDVTVIVATFGEPSWIELGVKRAVASVARLVVPMLYMHGASLHQARNAAAYQAKTEWLVFLDADDELEVGYFDAMDRSTADLRAPLVRYVDEYREWDPKIPDGTDDLANGNRLVIGTAVRRSMFFDVGGFRDWPFYEDWDLWQRCWLAGAAAEFTEAVYRAHMRAGSRNRSPSRTEKERVHHEIRRSNLPHLYEVSA
jgi:glycosyltransferase involved in cell wall biosynthesis